MILCLLKLLYVTRTNLQLILSLPVYCIEKGFPNDDDTILHCTTTMWLLPLIGYVVSIPKMVVLHT